MFLSLFWIPRQNSGLHLFLQPFAYCEAIRRVISVESWQVKSWPSNHVWKPRVYYTQVEILSVKILTRFLLRFLPRT